MGWDDPFIIAMLALLGAMALMFAGQMGYRMVARRGMHRDDLTRRSMRKLRALPIQPRRSNPAESSEESPRRGR